MLYRQNWPTILAYGLAAVVFVVVAGYAVLYGTGYRIKWSSFRLIKTGVLAVSTKPSSATMTLDGKKLGRQTPVTLRNLLPGDYHVKLELPKYRAFEDNLKIESGQVTEAHNIELVLTDIPSKTIVEKAKSAVVSGNTIVYLDDKNQLWKMSDGVPTEIKTDKLPEGIKTQIKNLTQISFASRYQDSNTWALLGMTGTKKSLIVVDDGGYRGQSFTTPYSGVEANNLIWIGSDRLMTLVSGTLYKIDLTLSRASVYAKDIVAAEHLDGHLVYVTRDKTGKATVFRDNNPFDEKVGESYTDTLPVGTSYELTSMDGRLIALTENFKVKGLWIEKTKKNNDATVVFQKVATDVKGMSESFEEHAIYFVAGNDLGKFDAQKDEETTLRSLGANSKFLIKMGESLFVQQDSQLLVADVDGQNLYPIYDLAKSYNWLAANGQKTWLSGPEGILELTLRLHQDGLFSGMFIKGRT